MGKEKYHKVEARMSDSAYQAWKNGDAVCNNGLRSKKGSFWPDQPDFYEKTMSDSPVKTALVNMAVGIGEHLVLDVIVPGAIRLFEEELYPYVVSKIRKNTKKPQNNEVRESVKKNPSNLDNLIVLDDYRPRKTA